MGEPATPGPKGPDPVMIGFGEFAGVWDRAYVASPQLRQTQTCHHDAYSATWSAEKGVEIRASVKGYKAMVAARKFDTVEGGRRAITDVGSNLLAQGEVVVFVTPRFKPVPRESWPKR